MTSETETKLKEDFRNYQRKLGPLRIISVSITILTMAIAYFDRFPWTIVIDGLEKRLIFTLQLLFIDCLPLIIAISAVINVRMTTIAINPMDSRGHGFIEQRQRILQNTLEQLIVKLILSLTLCTILRSNELIILPVFTILFVFGRFTFALGYPYYRSFGMGMNVTSTVLVILLIGYRLLIERILFQHIKIK